MAEHLPPDHVPPDHVPPDPVALDAAAPDPVARHPVAPRPVVPGLTVTAPLAGTVVALSGVPDPVFADALVGPGIAIDPAPDARTVGAPIAGILMKVKPHAFVVISPQGQAVLVHLGIDTVSLAGDGFTVRAAEGSAVAVGDPIVEWDPTAVVARGLSAICPIIALEAAAVTDEVRGTVRPGDQIFTWPPSPAEEAHPPTSG